MVQAIRNEQAGADLATQPRDVAAASSFDPPLASRPEGAKSSGRSTRQKREHRKSVSLKYDDLMEEIRLEEEAKSSPPIPIRAWPTWGGVCLAEAKYLVGSPEILALMRRAEWIRPVAQSNRMTIFDRAALQKAWERLADVGLDILKEYAAQKNPRRLISVRKQRNASLPGRGIPSSSR